jgi:hypothetical protein
MHQHICGFDKVPKMATPLRPRCAIATSTATHPRAVDHPTIVHRERLWDRRSEIAALVPSTSHGAARIMIELRNKHTLTGKHAAFRSYFARSSAAISLAKD